MRAKFWYFVGSSPSPGEISTDWPSCLSTSACTSGKITGSGAVPSLKRLSIVMGLRRVWSQVNDL